MIAQAGFRAVGEEPDVRQFRRCRRMLVGPWCNQPEQYEGYNGFVGWAGVTRLRSGRWLLAFNSGYWHASYPWTEEIREEVRRDAECWDNIQSWRKLGMPEIRAPRGGRLHLMRSDDEGLTWSAPETLVDTEMTDLHPTIVEMDDGALLCTFCSDRLPNAAVASHMLSVDGGETWGEPIDSAPGNAGGFGNGSTIVLSDGTVLWPIEVRLGRGAERRSGVGVFLSGDKGRTFERAALVGADRELYEPSVAELPDGRLVMITRRGGDVTWSEDGGHTWTDLVPTGVEMYDPHLLLMPNGVLACFHGSYHREAGNLRVILSLDGGRTWQGPGERYGYSVDPSVYGYCHPMVLADGTAYVTYIHSGGHSSHDARTEAIWAVRVRVHDGADGIDILPAPGSPAARGRPSEELETMVTDGGDPELGNLEDLSDAQTG